MRQPRPGLRPLLRRAGDDMHADIAGMPDQLVRHRALQPLAPLRFLRLADDDVGDVVGGRIADDFGGDVLAGQHHRLAAQLLGETQAGGQLVLAGIRDARRPRRLDVERHERPAQAVGQPPRIAHQ